MINSSSSKGGNIHTNTSSSYQQGETIIEEDEDTIVTRTIETRPVRRNQTGQMSFSTTNFTSPSRNMNSIIITGNTTKNKRKKSMKKQTQNQQQQQQQKNLRQSMVSGVLTSPNRYNLNRNYIRGNAAANTQFIQGARYASPTPNFVTYGQATTTNNAENVDYITTETITTRKKKGSKKIESMRKENKKLRASLEKMKLDLQKYKNGGNKVYVLEKENRDLKSKLTNCRTKCRQLEKETDQLRVHLAVKDNTKIRTGDDEKWKFIKKEIERLSDELRSSNDAKKKSDKNFLEIKAHNLKLASENNRLNDKLTDFQTDYGKLRNENNQFREKMRQFQMTNLTLQNSIDSLNLELNRTQNRQEIPANLDSELQSIRELLDGEKEKNDGLNKQLSDALAQIQSNIHLDETMKKLNSELDDKAHQFSILREDFDSMRNERDNLLIRIDELEKVKPEDEELMNQNRNEIEDLSERCDQYEIKIGELETYINQIEVEKKDLIDECEILKSEYIQLEKEYDTVKSENQDNDTILLIKEENESLKRLNEQIRLELEKSRGDAGKSNEFSELSKKLSDLENKLTRDSNSHELNDLRVRNRELESKIKTYEKKERRWSALQKDLQTIKDEFNNDKMLIINLTRDKEDLQRTKKQLEIENKRKDELMTEQENDVDEWKNKCFHLEKRLELGDDENQNLHYIEEIEGLKQMVEEKEEELRLWQNEVRRLEEEIGHIEDGEDNIHEMGGRIGAMEEEIKLLSDENDKLRQENEDLNAKFEGAEEIVQDNENLRELLRQLRAKLAIQLESNDKVWKMSQNELELKMKLKEEINTKITLIQREATGETSEAARYYQQEISKIHAENEKLNEENDHMQSRIDELKEEVQILRDEHMEHHVMMQEGEEEMDEDMTR